ncbi:GNAT family N-acetyltransferase [Chitinimonas koreensis]|uniref:GNAT family N-acetyltransferase n=1 Tax=Chitinimonas koreensis TaxID=356302 RepID=UPI0004221A62|nr:GNAT family N-acetyltransferase [Chitinimonas koreensis]QNM98419.1 GNAT family N-acetyltransferase [Chitinimonas koreensis]
MAKGVQLRLMAASDWEACRALCGAGFGGAQCELPSQDVLKRFLARNPFMSWVACDEAARVVGCVLCGTDAWRGYLYHLVVESAFRRRGIGELLLGRAMGGLQKFGIQKALILSPRGNPDMELLLLERGWRRGDDVTVYVADLSVPAT